MSYAYMERDGKGKRIFHLYSELDLAKKIIPLVRHILDLEALIQLEYSFLLIDLERINYLRFTLTKNKDSANEFEDPFNGVFSTDFLKEHLPEAGFVNGTNPRRSGSKHSEYAQISRSSAKNIQIFYDFNQDYSEKVVQCRRKYKKTASEPSVSSLHDLAEEFQLAGGSWTICSKKGIESENEQCNTIRFEASKNSFLEIMSVLKREQIPASAFKALRWRAHTNGRFTTELVNNNSNYYSNFLEDSSKSELWYYSYDNEVKLVYRLLVKQECLNFEKQELFYQSEIVSVCKIRQRAIIPSNLFYLYGSLKHEDMMHITEEALSEAEKLSVNRFEDPTNKQEETHKTEKVELSKAFGCIQV